MAGTRPLGPEELRRAVDLGSLNFKSTVDLEPLQVVVGQERASASLDFGVDIDHEGFNIFALGSEATGMRQVVRQTMERWARTRPAPDDICFVNNFADPHRPKVIVLPPGTGRGLMEDMERFAGELQPVLASGFESEEYQSGRQLLEQETMETQQAELNKLQEQSRERGLTILRTPGGFVFAPLKEGEVLPPHQLEEISQEDRERLDKSVEELQEELQRIMRQAPRRQHEVRERVTEMERQLARSAAQDLLGDVRERYGAYREVLAFLQAVEDDVVENARQLAGHDGDMGAALALLAAGGPPQPDDHVGRYKVNLLVDHADSDHAPVLYEDHPTFQNLVGRVEYRPHMGGLVTDFKLIRAGAMHRANGGVLILDARRLLMQPYAWEGLKRLLQSQQLRIQSPAEALGLVSVVTLEPEPIPFEVKVVLLGDRLLYYMLSQVDPDFLQHFKVTADFDEDMAGGSGNAEAYVRMLAGMVEQRGLKPFSKGAVVRVIEEAARMAGDHDRLSLRTLDLMDLLREADHWARGAAMVEVEHVAQAVEQARYRGNRLKDETHRRILEDVVFISTQGSVVGQVNALSVVQLGGTMFGQPSRITARVRLGRGEVVNIDREAKLSGPLHSKGVLILAGFLAGRYGSEEPLSLSASLVFEQSYGGVEGDSASCAELCALLSAIGAIPVRQAVAITGSVNQLGEVQPVGGINEKIEGFFEVCAARGLTGDEGVVIPAANTRHLMLRHDVVEAARQGRFHIWPVSHIDQAMEMLTGLESGEGRAAGKRTYGTVRGRVTRRLALFARRRREYDRSDGDGLGERGERPGVPGES